jgi:hypothetical protein
MILGHEGNPGLGLGFWGGHLGGLFGLGLVFGGTRV